MESLGRGEHDRMENRRRPGHAREELERCAIEVADPHADGDVLRIADGPVVVIRLRGAGLHGDGEREFEAAATPEDVLARAVVGKHIRNPIRRERRDKRPTFTVATTRPARTVLRCPRRFNPFTATRQRRVGSHGSVGRVPSHCPASGRGRNTTASCRTSITQIKSEI